VEDHGNQLVRTFTGNLTKMLASAGGVLHPHTSIARPGKSATGGGLHPLVPRQPGSVGAAVDSSAGAAGMDSRGPSAAGDWSANRLMQTFSGPVRRRFGAGGTKASFGASGWQPTSVSEGGVMPGSAADGAAAGQEHQQQEETQGAAAGAGRSQSGKSRLGAGAGGARGPLGAMRDSGVFGQPGVERIDEGDAGEEASA
jgi:hypothetical protein